MSIDASLDLDDLFGDLDDIEQSIEELNAETVFDRHDRLKAAYLDANATADEARAALSALAVKHARAVGVDPDTYRAEQYFWDRAFDWNRSVYRYTDELVQRASRKQPLPAFTDAVPVDVREVITAAINEVVRLDSLRQAAHSAWLASVPEFQDEDSDDFTHLTEGCYVKWTDVNKNQWGDVSTEYTGYGTVVQITATNYVVRIDHDEIRLQSGWRDRHHFDGKENAMLKIALCFEDGGYTKGGRSAQFLWGPAGNAKRTERAAVEAAKREAKAAVERAAAERRDAARAEYEAAVNADREHRAALQRVQQDAEAAALDVLKAKYAAELTRLTKALAVGIEQSLSDYERPSILDNQPSNRWQDYVEEES